MSVFFFQFCLGEDMEGDRLALPSPVINLQESVWDISSDRSVHPLCYRGTQIYRWKSVLSGSLSHLSPPLLIDSCRKACKIYYRSLYCVPEAVRNSKGVGDAQITLFAFKIIPVKTKWSKQTKVKPRSSLLRKTGSSQLTPPRPQNRVFLGWPKSYGEGMETPMTAMDEDENGNSLQRRLLE